MNNKIIRRFLNTGTLTKGTEKPKCVDCKNFIQHIENGKKYDGLGKCRINGYVLSDTPTYFYASSCRNNDIYCGINAKFFKK